MSYLSNPIFLGNGFAGQVDSVSAFSDNFVQAFSQLKQMDPDQIAAVNQAVNDALAQLPAATRNQVLALVSKTSTAVASKGLNGLGDPISSTAGTVAAIASAVAALGTLGIGIYGMVQARKQSKAAQAAADQQNALVNADLAIQIQQHQAELDATKAANAPTTAGGASSGGSSATLLATLAAAGGAFFLAK